ncbi:hypothetical protein ACI76Y_02700 [Capnocytophaga cynodegmi]|uniref:hypothetical protein n=1 Tax=Capnocytophaga cynodegmi TaxID=28189 RepID=UPI00385E5519
MNRILIIAFMLMIISMAYAQKETDTVHIPDENFKRILLENKKINTNRDKEISYKEAQNYKGEIDVMKDEIKSLEGIEAFINITMLDCAYNQLTSLDLSENVHLERLHCPYNQLMNLDISKNIALKILNCFSNQLTSLDVSNNIALKELNCEDNIFTSLDISKNIALEGLDCSSNQLIKLNLANGNNEKIDYLIIDKNPNLKCIQIDKDFTPPAPKYFGNNWVREGWLKDEDAKYSDTCE